uniref:Uncharacterized protein n=1 Tax=Mucochytrium quahogii TaxID=96639 RepID=A0A7S2RR41_9STRA|mmetsp:Transcript_44405/g.71164  ORF Transcript_44405/g.71164 Transcript_44405/m.71164 type:complete len:103 (-) Transcript_44405:330-638(-)
MCQSVIVVSTKQSARMLCGERTCAIRMNAQCGSSNFRSFQHDSTRTCEVLTNAWTIQWAWIKFRVVGNTRAEYLGNRTFQVFECKITHCRVTDSQSVDCDDV